MSMMWGDTIVKFFSLLTLFYSLVIFCVVDLIHFSEEFSTKMTFFSTSKKVSASTLVVAINLVTCFSFLNNPWIADVVIRRGHTFHLHHCPGGTGRAGTSSWVIVDLTKATTHEAFLRTEGANDLQFSLTVEVLPSNNLKNNSLCRGCIKWENWYRLCLSFTLILFMLQLM